MIYRTLIVCLLLCACRTPQQAFMSESIIKSSDTLYIERTPAVHDTLYIPLPAVHTGSAPATAYANNSSPMPSRVWLPPNTPAATATASITTSTASSSSYTSSYKSNLTADNAQPSAPSKQSYKPRKYPYPTPPYTPKSSLR